MIKIGVIGYGYWGPNLVRNFSEVSGSSVISVSDLRSERLALAKSRYPWIKTMTDHRELIADPSIDAVVIATPVSTHFNLAMQALEAGKHVLVEKPMTATADEGALMIDKAQKCKRVLLVDHTFVYMGAVRKIRELIKNGELGKIYYYDSTRVNLGLFQHDVNVTWDLAVHDLAILDYVLGANATAISATGMSHVNNAPENVAYMTLFFDSSLIAHINVNWLSPVKVRLTLIGGSKKMIVFDDLQPSEKIKIYDTGITVNSAPDSIYEILIGYRTGDMWAPRFDTTEALKAEALHFIDCIENGREPDTNGEMGLRVVRILEAATKSIREKGKLVTLWE
ncbi:MAG: Gfo/Idh/MocA family oxidoreductase [Deltaproteobacteria bacterium]|nr:Gfo/Idh/MocA family oxidoreductase [Deltaproteobacteria bacterium]